MSDPPALLCPCGAPAPETLPAPGRDPVRCSRCATPLVAPGVVPQSQVERGLGAATIVAVLLAAAWAAVCHLTGTGAPWSLAVAGLAVGVAARAAARARGGRVQLAAGLALVVFFLLGEFLIYRHALLPRLVAMHTTEGSPDAEILAQQELERIHDDVDFYVWPERYASLEATRDLCLAMAAGIAAALWVTRARPAVAAFSPPAARAEAPAAEEPATGPSSPWPSSSELPSSEPPASPPSSPASPGPEPPSARSPDAT